MTVNTTQSTEIVNPYRGKKVQLAGGLMFMLGLLLLAIGILPPGSWGTIKAGLILGVVGIIVAQIGKAIRWWHWA
jgi:hypothetical protein